MTFVQLEFIAFFVIVLTLYWAAPMLSRQKSITIQNVILLIASLIFYGWVEPIFIGLLLFSTLLDYGVGQAISRHRKRKKLWLSVSFAGNLGMLFLFKYYDWFVESWGTALSLLGFEVHPHTLGLILPVGLSFYTFQTLSYSLEVYYNRIQPTKNILSYATYVCMFPQLVAGPVERADTLLPQIEKKRTMTSSTARLGISLMLWGFVQKVVVADNIALYVDTIYALPNPEPIVLWAGTFGFMVQILADFSGYSSIARGCAYLLGFTLQINFLRPYLSLSPAEFWRSWHISLSTWFHKYVYIPMGGNRHGFVRWVIAVWTTMLLSGLWHGAHWNVVLWGGAHALWMTIWKPITNRIPMRKSKYHIATYWILMMFVHQYLWVLFREKDLNKVVHQWMSFPLEGSFHGYIIALMSWAIFCMGALIMGIGGWARQNCKNHSPKERAVEQIYWACAVVLICIFARDTSQDFIYFRF